MAIPHFRGTFVSAGTSPLSAAAYNHRTAMTDHSLGQRYAYKADDDLVYSDVAIPAGAPDWLVLLSQSGTPAQQSAKLWNFVIEQERQICAQTARKVIIALPIELDRAQNIALVRDYVSGELTARGYVVDWVFHDKPGNPHVHIMHTLRPLTAAGFGPKRIAVLDETGVPRRGNGNKIVYRQFIGNASTLVDLRTAWAATVSHHLAKAGRDIVLDLRSYKARGIKLTATTHIGPAGTAFQRSELESSAVRASIDAKSLAAGELERDPGRIIELVSSQKSVFDQRDIAGALHTFLDDEVTFTRAYQRALAHPSLVVLAAATRDPAGPLETPAKLATAGMIALEQRMADRASSLARGSAHALAKAAVIRAVLTSSVTLTDEQEAAVYHVTARQDLAAIVGYAGAGKSTLLSVANTAWTGDGRIVAGAALAGKAARELQMASGIPSRTIASWTMAWSRGRDQLTAGHVFVLDEAGMVSSRDMAAIMAEVTRAGAKLVLVGDPEQLQPIGAGGAFRALVAQCGAFELAGVRRQKAEWARAATVAFQRGQVDNALSAYATHGAIVFKPDRLSAATSLVEAYLERLAGRTDQAAVSAQIALAHRNDDVLALNTALHERRAALGHLGSDTTIATTNGSRSMAAGDRILFLKNASLPAANGGGDCHVTNGTLGSILEIAMGGDGPVITVATDEGTTVVVDTQAYPDIDLGYATTIHKAQGATVDRAFVLTSSTMDKHLAYFALSRHREGVTLFVPQSEIAIQ
jgi:Ti-type conjugative transfer relaxase TraA